MKTEEITTAKTTTPVLLIILSSIGPDDLFDLTVMSLKKRFSLAMKDGFFAVFSICHGSSFLHHFVSLWSVCFRQNLQYFFSSILSGSFFLFFMVL
jgi:hypothetical protein